MKDYRYIILLALCVSSSFFSCRKDYEEVPLEQVTIDYVFNKDDSLGTDASKFLTSIYAQLPEGYNRVNGDLLDAASDDAVSGLTGTSDVQKLATGAYSSWSPISGEDKWAACYNAIRDASTFVSNIDVVPVKATMPNGMSVKYAWKSEARFLRAFFYFELLKRYGGTPLMGDKVRHLGEDVELPRNSFAECVNYIVSECDAIKDSIWTNPIVNPEVNSHRATKGAVLALKTRVLLYAASPLFNGGNIDPGNPLTGYTDYQADRWKLAADAAKEVIDLHAFSLLSNFKNIFTTQNNSEIIFIRQGGNDTNIESSNGPIGFGNARANGRTNPTQELVDAFPMLSGVAIKESGSGYDPNNPYEGRDPRLQMSVLYNGAPWLNTTLETFEGGQSKPGGSEQQTKTSYYMRKFMGNFETATQYSNVNRDWISFRYSEVLLNFAEAQNEYSGPAPEIYEVLKDIRRRAGIDEGSDSMYGLQQNQQDMTKEDMRSVIRNERRIELAFEEHRFWDIRRWKIADRVMNSSLHGMVIIRSEGIYNYNTVEVLKPKFKTSMYLYPIPYDEVVKNGNMVQNPGW